MSSYYMPGILLSILHLLTHSVLHNNPMKCGDIIISIYNEEMEAPMKAGSKWKNWDLNPDDPA